MSSLKKSSERFVCQVKSHQIYHIIIILFAFMIYMTKEKFSDIIVLKS